MSLTKVKPYFKSVAEGQGFTIWPDGFNFENIPENLIDRAYHLELDNFSGEGQNQQDQEMLVPIIVRCFFKGFRDPDGAIDTAIQKAEDLITDAVKPSNRLTQYANGIKNVVFINGGAIPIAESNDNTILLELNFSVRVILQICE